MLRDYQARAVEMLEAGDLFVSPTGTGKTRTLTEVAAREAVRGGLALWCAHRSELLFQAARALRDAWLTPGSNVHVRSIQELRRGGKTNTDVTLLLVDEAHHLGGDDWGLLPEQFPRASIIGATATPQRGDGRSLNPPFKRIVSTISVREAIDQGYLSRFEILRPERPLGPGELAQRPEQAWVDHARGLKTIVFYPTVELAIQGACAFREAGARAAAVWGAQPAESRNKAIELFAAGEIQVLCSVNLLTEGFDVPDVECVILARGFGTAAGYIQAVGRALRVAPGKTRALILDLRGCSHEHGDPDEERTYHLEGKGIRRITDSPDVRFCPVCGSPTVTGACEVCGHSGAMRLRPPRVLGLPLDRFARVRQDDTEQRAERLARWMRECLAKGWKEGRALYRYKGTYDEFPPSSVVQRARQLAR